MRSNENVIVAGSIARRLVAGPRLGIGPFSAIVRERPKPVARSLTAPETAAPSHVQISPRGPDERVECHPGGSRHVDSETRGGPDRHHDRNCRLQGLLYQLEPGAAADHQDPVGERFRAIEHGAADLGIVGKDILLEQERVVYEPLDLGFGVCRLVLAAPAGSGDPPTWQDLARKSHLRVAAKFVRITERFFGEEAVPVDVIKLSGAVELAPVMGLADAVVDLVETGETLRENGLVEVREILRTSARLIVNRASQKTRREEVGEFIRVCQRKLGS